jgi:hypothetical protein
LREDRRLRVSWNRALRKKFGSKRDEVTGKWRKLHNEELNDLYWPPNVVQVIKSRRMRWAGHVARIWGRGDFDMAFWSENLRGGYHFENKGVDGSIILKWIFDK